MGPGILSVFSLVFCYTATALKYDPAFSQYNLNENKTATNPLDYWGEWTGHQYTPSPTNWRSLPFYSFFIDRFVNGAPENDNINSTLYEHDLNSNQMRHGGDLQGVVDTLDYLQGMGVKVSHSSIQACIYVVRLRNFLRSMKGSKATKLVSECRCCILNRILIVVGSVHRGFAIHQPALGI